MILKGEKVVLRPLRLSDAAAFVKWFNDPEVNKYMNVRGLTLAEEKKWIQGRLKDKSGSGTTFCVETSGGKLIGNTSLEGIHQQDKRASFGIIIGEKDYWNLGFGSDAARTILNFGFKKLKLHKISLDVYSYNPRAIKVYERLGFKMEGIKREHTKWRGKYYDAYLMSVLDREWKIKNK